MPVIDTPTRHYRADVPAEASGIAVVRADVRSAAARWGLSDETAYDMLVVVSELSSNALLYGGRPAAVSVEPAAGPDGASVVAVEVRDAGEVTLDLLDAATGRGCYADDATPQSGALRGRGLLLVRRLGWDLRVIVDRTGKTVRAVSAAMG